MIEQLLDMLYTRPEANEAPAMEACRQKTRAALQTEDVFAYDGLPWDMTGWVWFVVGKRGLVAVQMTPISEEDFVKKQAKRLGKIPRKAPQMTEPIKHQLAEYFDGERMHFDIDIDWRHIPDFQADVLRYTINIQPGEVATYGAVAKAIGKPKSARAVGRALGANPIPIVIPCHRVIGSDGSLTGYAGGVRVKAHLLKMEGYVA